MTAARPGISQQLTALADAVLLPCFDGLTAPEWVRRRVSESLGGVCLFARNVADLAQVAELSASLTAERESVVIAIDEEAGDVTRLDAATGSRFPGAAALGVVDDIHITQQIAFDVGQLLRAAGVTVNLAPCVDVTLDLSNPVIGSRAFGINPELVARHTAAWVTGQQQAGVATCAKHFPGHGNTDADSHHILAVLKGDREAIFRDAIPPFSAAIAAGTAAIMPGHLLATAVDDVPATVSRRWLSEILRGELGFTGTIISDALEMRGVADTYGISGAAVAALQAGADLLCIGGQTRPENEINAIRDAIVDAVVSGSLPEERLAQAAERSRKVGATAVADMGSGVDPGSTPDSITLHGGARATSTLPPISATSMAAASRALHTVGELPPLQEPVVIVRCSDTPNIAVGVVPWGPATTLSTPHVEVLVRHNGMLPATAIQEAGSVILVTRDRHRHPWMIDVLHRVRSMREDAILVEMGISGVTSGDAPAIASFGATLANSYAVVQLLH